MATPAYGAIALVVIVLNCVIGDYTLNLSAVIKSAWLIVITHAYQTRQQSFVWKAGWGISQLDVKESTQGHIKWVKAMTQQFVMLTGDRYLSWKRDMILYQEI